MGAAVGRGESSAQEDDPRTSAPVSGPGSATPRVPRPPAVLIARPRVEAFLSQVHRAPVSVVVAPAGSGKTAAAAAWVRDAARRGGRVVWVPVVEPHRHAAVLATALASGTEPGLEEPPVVVIDDAHELDPGARALVRRHLKTRPDSAHLLILSREDVDLVPRSLVLEERARWLSDQDMTLTPHEAATLLRLHHQAASESDVATVLEHTQCRAAAVVLAGLLLDRAPAATGARDALRLDGGPSLEDLVHEVFRTCPSELQHVLLSVCRELQVNDEEAAALSGDRGAGRMLAGAAEAGFLVTAYVDDPGTGTAGVAVGWRLNPLLRDLLRTRARAWESARFDASAGHARAARYFLGAGDRVRAVRYASLSADDELLAELLVDVGVDLILLGESPVLEAGLDRLDAARRRDGRPVVAELVALRALLLRGAHRDADAKSAADEARSVSAAGWMVPGSLRADLAILGAWQARYGWEDPSAAVATAREVLGCRHDGGGQPGHDLRDVSAMRAGWLLGELAALEVWTGDLAAAAAHVQVASTLAHVVEAPRLTAATLSLQATVEMITGAYQTSLATAAECLVVCETWGLRDTARSRALLASGWARFHALELDGAERDLALAREHAADLGDPYLLTYARLLEACVLTARGDAMAASRLLDGKGVVTTHPPAFVARHTAIVRLLGSAYLGDHAGIRAEAEELDRRGWPLDAAVARAVAEGVGDRPHAGLVQLERVRDQLPPDGTLAAAAVVTRAALLQVVGTPEALADARVAVPDVLSRTSRHRLLWILSMGWLISPAFGALLEEPARGGRHRDFAREALDLLDGRLAADEGPAHDLTERELDVLRQVAWGASNADIASTLFITENTVKTHLASVFRKLSVDRRSAAARVARERHLL